MRCAKSQNLYHIATVPLQICNGTDKCGKIFYCFIFFFSLLSLHFFSFLLSQSPVPLLSNLTLSLCLPLPVSLDAVALLDLGASVLTKTLTFAAAFSAFGDPIPWLIALAFNTIGWTDRAKAAIVPGLVSLIVGVICNGSGVGRWLFGVIL